MINLKSNKGITIVSLVITIIILIILSSVIIYNFNLSDITGDYNYLIADIGMLSDKILVYYNKFNDIPTTNRTIVIDGTEFFEIKLSELENITLNFGKDYGKEDKLTNSSDVYLVDETLNIYYLKGVEMSGEIYHTK